MTEPLLIEHNDGVDWVTLNRPKASTRSIPR